VAKKVVGEKKKHPGGRPTKFSKEVQDLTAMFSRKGFTDEEMAKALRVTRQTFDNWKKKFPKFFASLKDWKHEADSKVERSLYERAFGYTHPETKVFCNNGEIITEKVVRHYPPDPTSMIFWLKNRQPDKWRDKTNIEHSGDVTVMKPAAVSKSSNSGISDG
jgi:hypothetical protein